VGLAPLTFRGCRGEFLFVPKCRQDYTTSCRLIYMSNDKMYAVKITSGFENNVSFVGRYETKAEAIAAARYMKAKGIRGGRYYLAVPVAA